MSVSSSSVDIVTDIPFNRPYTTGREAELMLDAVARGHLSGDGHYTKVAREILADITGVPDVLLTTSCTHALEMTALLLELQEGDEIILPSFTFVSTANAFVMRGAVPVFVDIKRGTNNLDETLIEQAITARTRAIVVVHYAGVACEMDEILELANRHGLVVIEDNAHGLGGTYRGRKLGSLGAMSTLSFHETKNVHCGEGGALVIGDPAFTGRAEILREKGTNRSSFFRGQVDKYTWVDIGSSYLPSDLLAAFLTAQLEAFADIQRQRMAIWQRYDTELILWAKETGFELPTVPDHVQHPAHLYWMLATDLETRSRLIAHMAAKSIKLVFHYVPLHNSPAGLRVSAGGDLPVTEDVSDRIVRLPLFAGMTLAELDRIIELVLAFR